VLPPPGEGIERGAILKLAQRLFLLPGTGAAPRTVLFCSVGEVNRSSPVSAHLAQVLAVPADSCVCLVDANFYSPSLHRFFESDGRHGLTDALRKLGEIRSCVRHLMPSNVWLLPGGSSLPDAHTFLTEDRLRPCLAALRSQFDRVLIDAPPFGLHEDALWLGRLTDGVVLVVEAGATRRDQAVRAKEGFDAAGVKVLGAVLTEHTVPIPTAFDRFL
jgi:Mrp family chromosome partitioning ATPase